MTHIKLFWQNGHIVQVDASGHSGFAPEGEDIVCAAVSSLVQGAFVGLRKVANLAPVFRKSEAFFSFCLPQTDMHSRYVSDIILETMRCSLKDIAKEHISYVKVEDILNV
ncbi:MAG: ribosomal-processing cysteine protease Prp [Firmicutes bacterium]|nr:ribosomal-processing cysteine protease Prp [Bacillota bacterium]